MSPSVPWERVYALQSFHTSQKAALLRRSPVDLKRVTRYILRFGRIGQSKLGQVGAPTSSTLAIKWAEALIFVYPTWWYGLPAMLKGWLDRVWVPYATFTLPRDNTPIRGLMDNIVRIVGISTSGASRLWLAMFGNPGRRTITRGVRALCHPRCRTQWFAHYNIDRSTAQSRQSFLDRVGRELAALK